MFGRLLFFSLSINHPPLVLLSSDHQLHSNHHHSSIATRLSSIYHPFFVAQISFEWLVNRPVVSRHWLRSTIFYLPRWSFFMTRKTHIILGNKFNCVEGFTYLYQIYFISTRCGAWLLDDLTPGSLPLRWCSCSNIKAGGSYLHLGSSQRVRAFEAQGFDLDFIQHHTTWKRVIQTIRICWVREIMTLQDPPE